jgi:hypothetical protein
LLLRIVAEAVANDDADDAAGEMRIAAEVVAAVDAAAETIAFTHAVMDIVDRIVGIAAVAMMEMAIVWMKEKACIEESGSIAQDGREADQSEQYTVSSSYRVARRVYNTPHEMMKHHRHCYWMVTSHWPQREAFMMV